jgi:hypothetical protein
MAIWYIYSHLVYFVAIWNILWSFGIHIFPGTLQQEKSGNPVTYMYVCMYVCTNLQRMIKFFCTPQWALSGEVKQFHGVVIFGFICCTLPTAATDQGRNQNRPWGQT